MSWDGPGVDAVRVDGRAPECSPNGLTSIAVVWVPDGETQTHDGDWDPFGEYDVPQLRSAYALRMYNVEVKNFVAEQRALTFDDALCFCVRSSPAVMAAFEPYDETLASCSVPDEASFGGSDERVQYLDAVNIPTGRGFTVPEFVLGDAASRGGAPLLRSTCVPRFRYFASFDYTSKNYLTGTPTAVTHGNGTYCYHGGTDVVRLPSGQWLMLEHCWTTFLKAGVSVTAPDTVTGWEAPNCVFTDIVCWVADDADFTAGLRGPFLLVSSLDALPADELPSGMATTPRLMLGVPSGVVADGYLYVYYAVDKCFNFDDRSGESATDTQECDRANTEGGDQTDGTILGDYASRGAYASGMNAFEAGIAVKRIPLHDLNQHLGRARPELVDQATWDSQAAGGSDPACPGDLLGQVRVWITPNPLDYPTAGAGEYQLFKDALCLTSLGSPRGRPVDPAAVRCPDGHTLVLYFSQTSCDKHGAGGGLWRARDFVLSSTIEDVVRGTTTLVKGKDFYSLVTWHTSGTSYTSPDQLADNVDPTTGEDGQYQNPAVVRVGAAREWRVHSGGGLPDVFGTGGPSTLNLFTGDDRDGGCT